MSNGLTFEIRYIILTFAKFEENMCRIDGEIAENHAILVNLTASICYQLQHEVVDTSLSMVRRIHHHCLKCFRAHHRLFC